MRGLKIRKQSVDNTFNYMSGGDPTDPNNAISVGEFDNGQLSNNDEFNVSNPNIAIGNEWNDVIAQRGNPAQLETLARLQRNPNNAIDNTSVLGQNELGQDTSEDAYIRRMMQRRSNPAIEALPENALFPGYGSDPMTQQGWSGYGFSIPTIYGSGSLYPWAVVDAKKRAQQEADLEYDAELAKSQPEYAHIANFTKDPLFYEAQKGYFDALQRDGEQIAKQKYGDPSLWSKIKERDIQGAQMKFKQFGAAHDQIMDQYSKMLADDKGYYSPISRRMYDEYVNGIDQMASNPSDPATFNKLFDIQQNIRKQANVADTVKSQAANIAFEGYASLQNFISNGDYDSYKLFSGKAPFIKKDDKGMAMFNPDGTAQFDQTAFDDYVKGTYADVYGGEENKKYAPLFETYKKEMQHALTKEFKLDLKDMGKYNAGARAWEHRENAKTDQKIQQDFTASTENISMGDGVGGTQTALMTNTVYFQPKPNGKRIKIPITGTGILDAETGLFITIKGVKEASLIKSGNIQYRRHEPGKSDPIVENKRMVIVNYDELSDNDDYTVVSRVPGKKEGEYEERREVVKGKDLKTRTFIIPQENVVNSIDSNYANYGQANEQLQEGVDNKVHLNKIDTSTTNKTTVKKKPY
jgi:hypothetical protein